MAHEHAEAHEISHSHGAEGDDLPAHGALPEEPRSPAWLPILGIGLLAVALVWWLSTPSAAEEARAAAEAAASASASAAASASASGSAAPDPGAPPEPTLTAIPAPAPPPPQPKVPRLGPGMQPAPNHPHAH